MEEPVKLALTPQQITEIKKQIGFELREIYLTKRSLNKLRVFRLRLNEEQQQVMEEQLGQKVKELTVTRSVATRILYWSRHRASASVLCFLSYPITGRR